MVPMAFGDLFTLKSGRQLAVHTLVEGVSDRTVVLCHAAPGAGMFDTYPEATWARGITLLSVTAAHCRASGCCW
jgi:hypothetical protein